MSRLKLWGIKAVSVSVLAATTSLSWAHSKDTEAQAQLSRRMGDMMLEMQALRDEIAELRDLSERQQYDLQRFKQQQAKLANSQTANQYEPRYVPTDQGLVQQTPQLQRPAAANELIVEDSALTPTPASPAQINDGYPPVEERVIGGELSVGNDTGASDEIEAVAGGADIPEFAGQVQNPDAIPRDATPTVAPDFPRSFDSSAIQGSAPLDTTQEPLVTPQVAPGSQAETTVDDVASETIVGTPIDDMASGASTVIAVPSAIESPATPEQVTGQQLEQIQPEPVATQEPAAATSAQPAGVASTAIEATLSEMDYYQQAFEQLKRSRHDQAVDIFKTQIEKFPYGEYADDANYWIAESKYVNRDLDESKKYFKIIIDSYKQSPRLPDAMLKTAYIEQEQGNNLEARLLLQEILQYHPSSNAAISAKNRLVELGE